MFPATLFDFNGVLVDDELVHLEAFRDAVRPLGIELTCDEYFERYLGFDDAGAFRALLTAAGRDVTDEEVAQLIEAKRPHYMSRAQQELRTFPGAAALIRRRFAVGPVGVVSGALRAEIEFGLAHLGVRDLVGSMTSAEDTQQGKPDPEGYRLGMAWLTEQGIQASRALVFEDSLDGIVAAKAVGLPCVALAHSYPRERLLLAGADLVIDRLELVGDAELAALYQRLYP